MSDNTRIVWAPKPKHCPPKLPADGPNGMIVECSTCRRYFWLEYAYPAWRQVKWYNLACLWRIHFTPFWQW